MTTLWAGRISKGTDPSANDFNTSLPFDNRLYPQDILGSLVHSCMLEKQGIISKEEKADIHHGLLELLSDMNAGKIYFDPSQYEDIHTCVEQLLTAKIGDAGKKLHTGRSRNDQVALDLRLYVVEVISEIKSRLLQLINVLSALGEQYAHTIVPGYTHLQRAQPVTFGHVLMAYASMFQRDVRRLENALEVMDECPLGAGALAGTTFPLDREYTAKHLGFSKPTANSLDSVSDRDFAIEFLSDLSIIMMHMSRLCEEMIMWSSWEFKFIDLDDAFSTGSSIMPQKKNPDMCELIRGKSGRVYGDLITLLTVMKGLPLAYNKDMQEDKEAVFDASDTVLNCLKVLIPMLKTMRVLDQNMLAAAKKGFINATDCADYLAKKGMPFRDAYKLTGQLVADCIAQNKTLDELSLEELQALSPLFDQDFYEAIDLMTCVNQRKVYGGPAPESVLKQVEMAKDFIAKHK
ncbi:MAG: argininosuccinate lyase [Allobaculum sp.]|nr:argininosuccinate lyase [Allobaculum sp.]